MKKSLLIASLFAVTLAACAKKEEAPVAPVTETPAAVVAPADATMPAADATAPAAAAADAAATDAAAAAWKYQKTS